MLILLVSIQNIIINVSKVVEHKFSICSIMKKKLLILISIIAVVAIGAYFYAYQGHRDIKTESADFTVTISDLQKEFTENDSLANRKYADKTIQISGKITAIDVPNKGIVIDEKLFGTFDAKIPNDLSVGKQVKVKGRFLGYDELLEEFKIDQISIVE